MSVDKFVYAHLDRDRQTENGDGKRGGGEKRERKKRGREIERGGGRESQRKRALSMVERLKEGQ